MRIITLTNVKTLIWSILSSFKKPINIDDYDYHLAGVVVGVEKKREAQNLQNSVKAGI
jgi:hypothetical protein